ncbi:hypothetical protein PS15p_207726 [Mucor circinelloides]
MRSTIAISAAIATFATSAFAANCNPSYNVPGSTECFTACNVKNGQKWVPGWTMDHTSELFLDSLALMCNKSGPNYGSFMAAAGMCMAGCTGDDPELFNAEFAGACAWWNTHKNDKCTAATTTAKTTSSTSTSSTKTSSSTSKSSSTSVSSTSVSSTKVSTTGAVSTTASTTSAGPTGGAGVTVTKTITKTVSACPTDAACQAGFKGKKNGRGPLDACCSHSDDCQESCINGKCNAPIASTCYTGSNGKSKGDGYNGACCEHSDDCWESCIEGKCNGPSLASCNQGFSGKKGGKGPKDACCSSNRDCKNSCVKGKCN